MNEKHPPYVLPDDPHAAYRYKAAMKHVELAKEAGKSSEEIHEIFQRIMDFDINNAEHLPSDCHKKYYEAAQKAKQALAEGKSSEEAHALFQKLVGEM